MYLGKVTRAFSDQINIFGAPEEKVQGGGSAPQPCDRVNVGTTPDGELGLGVGPAALPYKCTGRKLRLAA